MAIVQTVNFSIFCGMFFRMGRQDQFSYAAKQALFEYLDNLSEDTGEDFQMDVVGICCEYSEDTAEDINENYSLLIEKEEDEDDEEFQERMNEEVNSFLENHTTVITNDNGTFIYAQF
jgi:hypothetical protein